MNYYDEIKRELIENELNKKVKDFSKNKYELQKYYNIGKLLFEAGNKYGNGIIKEYSKKLTNELDKKYSIRYLFDIRKLYLFSKVHPVGAQLTMSHYRLLFPLNDNEIDYYIKQVQLRNLSKRQLENIIKNKEYERLPDNTKNKIVKKEETSLIDFIKNPIVIRNNNYYKVISEKTLQKLITDDIESFMQELGNSFCFIGSEYKIRLGNSYNYIDLLLFNYEYNCFVVVELKVCELRKEHIGQIQVYMNYIDCNLRKFDQDKTIGIIICREDNKYVIKYCSDDRIISRVYELT